jgi:hypothetical protein
MKRIIATLALASFSFGAVVLTATPAAAQRRTARSDEPFHWSGEIQRDHWVYVHNINGSVRVEQGTGTKVEVTATKRWRRGDPDEVKISVEQIGSGRGDVLVCAVWSENSTCDEDGVHSHRDNWSWRGHDNDTSVEFVVRLPAGVKVTATTVNGGVEVDGATAAVEARTVNGNVEARSTGGPVRVRTTNGDIDVRAGTLGDERLEYSTTNGSITLELPPTTNAELDMHTVNGGISSDFPLMVQGRFERRHMQATLGKGGPMVRLSTVNGSIRLRKA